MRKKKLRDVCNILNGYAFKSNNYVENGIRIIRITNVQKGVIEDDDPKYYPIEELPYLKNYILNENDLLISLTGNVGRVGLLGKSLLPAALNQRVGCLRIINDKEITIRYLFQALNNYMFENSCINNSKGIAQKNLSTEWLKEYEIKVPSIEEQCKISNKLEKVQNIILMKKEQIAKLNDLIKSQFVEMFGNPIANEKKWEMKEIQELVTSDCRISYGIVQTGEEVSEGVSVFRPIDIVNNIPKIEKLKKTTKEISEKYKKTILQGNELLITVRANIGDTYIIDESFKGCNVGRGITPLRFDEDYINVIFVKSQFDNEEMKREVRNKAKGIALLQLNMEDLRKIKLIIPPIRLQNQFAEFVKLIDKQKFKIQKSVEEIEKLQKSLMKKYFS